jgi:branched-chain amino acid aminotransferase
MEKVFLNDKLVDSAKARVPVGDSGFLYGAGLFETMRSCGGVVFALDDHLDRLFKSAEALSIDSSCDKEYIREAIYKVLKANGLSDARLRLTLTAGPMTADEEQRKSTLLITATKLQPYPPEYYKNGVMVVLCPFKQNPTDPLCGHKTTNYFSRMIALDMARRKRAAESLWFTVDNRLAEGCISNVFLVKDSVLYTPPLETPVLPGVARKAVCRIAQNKAIKLEEKALFVADLLGADEIFLTNVIMQVLPVSKVEKHTVGDGIVGTVTKNLQKCFGDCVKAQCGAST